MRNIFSSLSTHRQVRAAITELQDAKKRSSNMIVQLLVVRPDEKALAVYREGQDDICGVPGLRLSEDQTPIEGVDLAMKKKTGLVAENYLFLDQIECQGDDGVPALYQFFIAFVESDLPENLSGKYSKGEWLRLDEFARRNMTPALRKFFERYEIEDLCDLLRTKNDNCELVTARDIWDRRGDENRQFSDPPQPSSNAATPVSFLLSR